MALNPAPRIDVHIDELVLNGLDHTSAETTHALAAEIGHHLGVWVGRQADPAGVAQQLAHIGPVQVAPSASAAQIAAAMVRRIG